ncbi:hypothetical protein JW898_00590 [Candidatus Woesearchaeota archaeon]|nr:hypothetical protein [Candidatus Woesearchaeota archaeon]
MKSDVEAEVKKDVKQEVRADMRRNFNLLDRFHGLAYSHKIIFSILVGVGVVSFWRGVWLLMDMAFFPGNDIISGLFSTLLGLTILAASGAMIRVLTSG